MRRAAIALLMATVAFAAPLRSGQEAGAPGARPVGATVRRFVPPGTYNWRGAATHALVTTIWYPAASATAMSAHVIGPPSAPLFRLGEWADEAARANGTFPLIVLSHGTGGSAQIMAWLARDLASRGYVVAAVNHPGNNALEAYTAEGFLLWWERARDLTTVIDMLLRDREFGQAIDRRRIGAAGFSLGGHTMFAIAGGRTDPKLLQSFCRSSAAVGCADPPEFPNLFARWAELESSDRSFRDAIRQAGRSYRDPRIRSVFAIAPALGPAFTPDSLRRLTTSVAVVAGDADRIVPVEANAQRLTGLVPRASLTLLPGVGHYTFLATCTEEGARVQPLLCVDAGGVARQAIHRRTADLAARFFEMTLQ